MRRSRCEHDHPTKSSEDAIAVESRDIDARTSKLQPVASAPAPLVLIAWQALNIMLFDVPMTEVLSLNKALTACNVPYPPTLEHWIIPALKGRSLLDRVVVWTIIFAPVPLLPEMFLGLTLAFVAYIKVVLVLAVIGFPFCFGFIFLIWAHTWCFLWWPLFFSYYIVRGVVYGVPCRVNLICEGVRLGLRKCKEIIFGPTVRRRPNQGSRSPQMASMSTQAAWVAASAASAAGVDAGWRWVGKDIASPTCSSQDTASANAIPAMPDLPAAQVDEIGFEGQLAAPTVPTPGSASHGHLAPMMNQNQGSAMASAG